MKANKKQLPCDYLMVALKHKTLSEGQYIFVFEKHHVALLRLMDFHERQQSRFVRVCGLQKLTYET